MPRDLRRLLFVPDVHRPYHDARAWRLMLRAAETFEPDHVITLGDFFDCAPVSAHSKDVSRLKRFSAEVEDAKTGLRELKALGAKRYDFVEGNHEFRLPRYLLDKAPELSDLLTIPELLGLKDAGWNYVPYRSHLKIGHLHVTHEVGAAGAKAHQQARESFEGNVVIGHTHRMGLHYSGNARGKARVGAMFGWLGDAKKCDYMHQIQANRAWQLGFGVGYMEPNGVVHLQAVPIINYQCVLEGRLVQ